MATNEPALSGAAQLTRFLARYSPGVRSVAKAALTSLRRRVPGAVEFVYDNYNALVVGFGPNERPSDAWFAIAIYPRFVNLNFLQGAILDDPGGLLKGSGTQHRHIRLAPDASILERADVRALVAQAIDTGDVPFARGRRRKVMIRWISKKQRPRRP